MVNGGAGNGEKGIVGGCRRATVVVRGAQNHVAQSLELAQQTGYRDTT